MAAAYEIGPIVDLSFATAADLSTHQYKIVELTAENTVNLVNSAADKPLGVLQNKPKSGEQAIVRMLGVSKVKVNAAGLTAGDNVGTDAVGRAIAKTADKDYVIGRCLTTAAATADLLATVTVQTLMPVTLSV